MKPIFLYVFLGWSCVSIAQGPILYLPFNGNAADASGNGNNGTVNGATLTTDRFGNANSAYSFNGTSNYIQIPNSTSLQSPTTAITIGGWLYIEGFVGVPTAPLVGKTVTSSYGQYEFSIQAWNGIINVGLNPGGFSVAKTFSLNSWYFIASTWDGSTVKIYVDGVVIGSGAYSMPLTPDTNPLVIGMHSPGSTEYLKGKADDIRIYNRALSAAEIATLNGLNLTSTNPARNALNVATNCNIVMNFSEAINQTIIDGGTATNFADDNILISGNQTGFRKGTFTGNGTSTITFNPDVDFKAGEIVTVLLKTGVKDVSNNSLSKRETFQFTIQTASAPGAFSNSEIIITKSVFRPQEVNAADFDNDGDLDIVVAVEWGAKISLYENGNNWNETVISSVDQLGITSVYSADLDKDGDLDIISASNGTTNQISWYENGNNWLKRVISNSSDRSQAICVGDLDGDGDVDVLSSSDVTDQIVWYENGNSWNKSVIASTSVNPYDVKVTDLDSDGDLDVLSASAGDNTIAWYESGNNWSKKIISSNASGTQSVHFGDLDKDGDVDVLSASATNDEISWYENGNSWAKRVISSSADNAFSVYCGDVDGDGDLDVMSASYNDSKIAWYENGNNWNAKVISTSATNTTFVTAADMDGDKDLDVISSSHEGSKVSWYPNNSSGVPANSLLLYYNFDDQVIDQSLNDHNGTIQGMPVYAPSTTDRGKAASFNNAWRIVVNNSKPSDFALSGAWTIAFSLKPETTVDWGNGFLQRIGDDGICNRRGPILLYDDGITTIPSICGFHGTDYFNGNGQVDNPYVTGLQTGSWNRLIFVHRANNTGDIYVNGTKIHNNISMRVADFGTKLMSLGGNYLNDGCYGADYANNVMLDDFALFLRELTTSEIANDNLASPVGSSIKNNITEGLIAHYPFNSNANDASGNGNNGAVNGATLTTDRFGNTNSAYSFNGTSNYILVPNSSTFPSTAITTAFWFNRMGITAGNDTDHYISKELSFSTHLEPSNVIYSQVWKGSAGVWSEWSSGSYTVQNNNDWAFYVSTFDNTSKTVRVYINGVLVNTINETDPNAILRTSTQPLYIGRNGSSSVYFISGKMDDIRIYNRVLSASEISELYSENNLGLAAHYPFNGNANDESVNDNNGTVNGATLTTDQFGNANSAYSFNGTTNYITVPHHSSLNFGTGNFTYHAIIKTSVLPTGSWTAIISKHNTANWHDKEAWMYIEGVTGYPVIGLSDGTGIFETAKGTSSVCDGLYHSITGVREGAVLKIYVDGALKGTGPASINPNTNNPLTIGRSSYNNGYGYFNGSIDNVRIYNRALSEMDIINLNSICIKPVKPTLILINNNTPTPTLTSSSLSGNIWYRNDLILPGETNSNLTVTEPGTYKVQVKVDDCLSAFSDVFPIIITGDLPPSVKNIRIYPNPANHTLEILGINGGIDELSSTDMLGRVFKQIVNHNGDAYETDVSNLSSGSYLLIIRSNQSVIKIKFIKL